MARVVLNDIIPWVKTRLATDIDLKENIFYTYFDSSPPRIPIYGAHIWIKKGEFFDVENRLVGNISTETWKINVNIIINKRLSSDASITDAKGVSYWVDTIQALFKHQRNSGKFKDTQWEFVGLEPKSDTNILGGILTVETENIY